MIIVPFLFVLAIIPFIKKVASHVGAMDIPNDAEAVTNALKKHYNETFQDSNGMWIFTHRHLSGVTY